MGVDIKRLKDAGNAKKYWTEEEKRLKIQLFQESHLRAQGKLRDEGKEYGTVAFDIEDGGRIKMTFGRDRKVNNEDVARVLRNRPDLAQHVKVEYKLPTDKELAKLPEDVRALLLECTTTTPKTPTVDIELGTDDGDEE